MSETPVLPLSLAAVAILLAVVLYALYRASRRSQQAWLESATYEDEDFERSVPLLVATARGAAPVRREASIFDDVGRHDAGVPAHDDGPPFPRGPAAIVMPSPAGDAVERTAFAPAPEPAAPPPPPPPIAAEYVRRSVPRPVRSPAPPPAPVRQPREDGTLRLLPGRFEVIASCDGLPAELRFVSVSPGDSTVITFGRVPGETYRHVQLPVPTVSREHARLTYADGSWRLTNLSATNPTLVNGIPLAAHGDEHLLRDGDRIEMGEVVFRFRAG